MPAVGEDVMTDAFRATAPIGRDAWALFIDGTDLRCEGYLGGLRLDDSRGTVVLPFEGLNSRDFMVVPVDEHALYGPDSFLWQATGGGVGLGLASWDPAGPTLSTLAAPAGTALTAALYLGGWLYWIEADVVPDEDHFARLMRGRIDFSDVEQLWEIEIPIDGDGRELVRVLFPRITQDFYRFTAALFDGETGDAFVEVAMPLAGGSPTEPPTIDPPRDPGGYGLFRGAASGCVLFAGSPGGSFDEAPYLLEQPNDGTSGASPVWPDPQADAAWLVGWTRVLSLGLNASRTRAVLYGIDDGEVVGSAVVANSGDDGGHQHFTVEPHPGAGLADAYFFASI